MDPTRRDLLVGITAASLAAACGSSDRDSKAPSGGTPVEPAPDRQDEPSPWAAPGSHDAVAFPYAMTAGDATESSALLHVRTTEPRCSLVVMAQDGNGWTEVARVDALDPDGRSVRHEITDLAADTAHAWALYASDGTRRTEVGRFRTAPTASTTPRKLVFGATSCWGSVNPTYPSLSAAAARKVDAMFLLGDTVYADGSVSQGDYEAEWDQVLAKEHPRALFASASVIATWDDHEVDNNWVLGETVTPEQVANATAAFREAIPMGVGPGGSGLWRVLRFGSIAEVFVLDSRGERSPGQIVSDAQLSAMTEAIRASTATFKVVLCSVHLADHSQVMGPVQTEDRWQGFPDQREALVRACEETPGAFVITGDMHYSAVQLVGRPGEPGEALVEVCAGPAGSSIMPLTEILALAADETPQYLWVGETHTTSVLTLDPGTGEVVAEFLDDSGTVVHAYTWAP